MKKYTFRFVICTDNLCYGGMQVSREYSRLKDAKADLGYFTRKYGCCIIKKVRFSIC